MLLAISPEDCTVTGQRPLDLADPRGCPTGRPGFCFDVIRSDDEQVERREPGRWVTGNRASYAGMSRRKLEAMNVVGLYELLSGKTPHSAPATASR